MTENPPNPDDFPTPPPYPGQQPYQGQQPYGGQPQQYPGAPSPQYSGQGMQKHPRATTALVLGIVSLVFGFLCGLGALLGPFAWVIGGKAVKEIDANPGVWAGRSEANTGRILGIIATVLLILSVIAIAVLVGFGILAALNDPEFMSELEAEWDAASVLSGFFG